MKIRWRRDRLPTPVCLGFPCGSAGKESTCNVRDLGLIPGLGRSPGEGKGYPLQYSGLENPMNCSPWGQKELDTTEWLSLDFSGGRGGEQPLPFWAIGQGSVCQVTKEPHKCLRLSSSLISNTNQQAEEFPNQATLESNLFLDRPQRWLDFRVYSKVLMYKWENLGHLVDLRS